MLDNIYTTRICLNVASPSPTRTWFVSADERMRPRSASARIRRTSMGNMPGCGWTPARRRTIILAINARLLRITHYEALCRHQRDQHGAYSGDGLQDPFTSKKPRLGNKLVCGIPAEFELACTASFDEVSDLRKHRRGVHQRYAGAGLLGNAAQDTYVPRILRAHCPVSRRSLVSLCSGVTRDVRTALTGERE